MTDRSPRSTRRVLLQLAAAGALGATALAPALAQAPAPLKIGFIYVGPVGDAGWTFAHDNGRKAIVAKYGDRIKTTYVESVKEGPDSERVIRDLVAQGRWAGATLSAPHHES